MPTALALLLAPLLALGCQSALLALVTPSCAQQSRFALHAVALLALLATAVLAVRARRQWARLAREGGGTDRASQGPQETRRFLAASATAVATLSCLLVLLMWGAAWLLSPCAP